MCFLFSSKALPTHFIDSEFPTKNLLKINFTNYWEQKSCPFYRVLLPSPNKKWDPTIPLRFVVRVGSWRQLGSLPTCSHVAGRFIESIYGKQMSLCEERDRDRCVAFDLQLQVDWVMIGVLFVSLSVGSSWYPKGKSLAEAILTLGDTHRRSIVIKPPLNHQSVVAPS